LNKTRFWKKGLRSKPSPEGVDVEALKEQIKNEYQARKHKELNIQFEKRGNGFSLLFK